MLYIKLYKFKMFEIHYNIVKLHESMKLVLSMKNIILFYTFHFVYRLFPVGFYCMNWIKLFKGEWKWCMFKKSSLIRPLLDIACVAIIFLLQGQTRNF